LTAAAAAAVAEDVVLCDGALRPVVGGRVACPYRDAPALVDDCGDCRLLTWRSDDRLPASDCSTEPKRDK
jgi:hypothetical protein